MPGRDIPLNCKLCLLAPVMLHEYMGSIPRAGDCVSTYTTFNLYFSFWYSSKFRTVYLEVVSRM
jgi:hypothetical protein